MKKAFICLSLLGLLLAFEFPAFGQNDIIWVPIQIHVLFDNDGKQIDTVHRKITWKTINSSLAYTNRKFKNAGVQFFIYDNKIDSIKNTSLSYKELFIESSRNIGNNIKELTNGHKTFNALNLYIVPKHGNNQGGSARPPQNDRVEDTYLILNSLSEVYAETFQYLLTHELGHSFYLLHTFEPDKVPIAFCSWADDGICDTPKDPSLKYKNLGLIIKSMLQNGNFNGYTPDISNLMSYYYNVKATNLNATDAIQNRWSDYSKKDKFKFTTDQLERIRKFANKRREREITNFNYSPQIQSKPVIASISIGITKEIRWTHNSSTETGYFIERATNLEPQNFICVGGVESNIFIFRDNLPLPSNVSTIKYRVIPSNAKGVNAYSTEMSLNISPNVLLSTPDFVNSSLNQTNSPKTISTIINICKNTSFPIEYYTEGAFAVNNQFKIQLSDQNGNFGVNPLIIGTGTTSPINVTIPNQSFPNGNYKLRIVSTNPVTTSLASVDTYNIYPVVTPPAITATPANVSYGSASVLKATGCTGTVYWSFNKTGSTQVVKPTENTTYTAYCKTNCNSDEGTISITVNNTAGISNINYMEYFFDNDPGFGNGVAVNITPGRLLETTIAVNTTGLSQGLHTLHVRVKTASNQWSTTHTQTVLVYGTGNNNRIVKFEYFYDTDLGFDNGIAVTVSPDSLVYLEGEFRTNNLSQGLHRLFVRAKDGYNRWSTTEQTPVLVIGTGSTIGLLSSAEYFIDTDPGVGNATSVSIPSQTDATFSFNVNLSNVSQGVHVVYVRVKDNLNRWSTHQSQVFVKIPNTLTRQITKAEYFVDTDPGQGNATLISYSPNPAQEIIANISINANALSKGEHTIFVRVKDSNNVWSVIASKLFEVQSTPCPPVESLFLPSPIGLTQAMERIFSTSKIETNINSTYQAGNSVLLSPGFETKGNVVFKVIISGCIND